jgi:mannose-6-phosphate isomerase
MNKPPLYPLKFSPILKDKVWGGNKLANFYNKQSGDYTGESWELSGVDDNISVVANGNLKGYSLTSLIELFKGDLVGNRVFKNFGNKFPLLFKFIDAREDLSVQLHPDDLLANERHRSFGKTEMWYVMQADKGSRLILGFSSEVNKNLYLQKLSENKITDILHFETVKKGDSFIINPGTVHAIGGGIVLAEIQQTSDITYRIYDWDRPDIDGTMRELHNDLALDAINFDQPDAKLAYANKENRKIPLCRSAYFETNKLQLTKDIKRDLLAVDSFIVYMCMEGSAVVETEGFSEVINIGETILVPASIALIQLKSTDATILEVYIPQYTLN